MAVSGFYLWLPKQWTLKALRAITFFNPKLDGKIRDFNWHNVIGFWCSAFLLMTTLTGLVMSYPWANNLLFRLAGSEPPPQIQRPAGGGMKSGGKGSAQAPALPYNRYMNTTGSRLENSQFPAFT